MKRAEFYGRAQELREQHKYGFENEFLVYVVSQVFAHGDELPENIEFKYDVGRDYGEEYTHKLCILLDALDIMYDECWCSSGYVFKVKNPKFK